MNATHAQRLAPVQPTDATGPVKDLVDAVHGKLGRVPNMFRTMASSPTVLRSYLGLLESLAGGSLGPAVGEQIALAVAERNRCDYCLSAHTALGKLAGLSLIDLTGAREGTATDPKSAAVIRFALAVVESAGDVSDADLARVRSAGYGDAEIGEIIAHVALNVLTNYFNRAARTVVDFPRVEPALLQAAS